MSYVHLDYPLVPNFFVFSLVLGRGSKKLNVTQYTADVIKTIKNYNVETTTTKTNMIHLEANIPKSLSSIGH